MQTTLPPRKPAVLIVEDDPVLLLIAVEFIENAGFESVAAANADDAIAVLNARSDIKIVFTDVDMPGSMDGANLAAAVRDRWPPIEIIVTSGEHAPGDIALPTRGHFFRKPYDPARVVETLRKMAA